MTNQNQIINSQLKAHIQEVTGTIDLVRKGLWSKSEALDTVNKSCFFWMTYTGGPEENNQLADKLWAVIVQGKKLCTNETDFFESCDTRSGAPNPHNSNGWD